MEQLEPSLGMLVREVIRLRRHIKHALAEGDVEIVKDKPVAALMRMRELLEAALIDGQPT